MQQIGFFIAKLTVRSTCFGHHYAHHQELKRYTNVRLRTHNPQLHTRPTTCKPKRQVPQAATICITLELLMMGIMVPETCWANNKFYNKETNLLHLVGLLISTYTAFHCESRWLNLFREIVAVCSRTLAKPINSPCGQNADFFTGSVDVTSLLSRIYTCIYNY